MNANPLLQLHEFGQSYWLDNLTRGMLESGELERRVREEGLRGVTSNPAIFHKAITGSADYDARIRQLSSACTCWAVCVCRPVVCGSRRRRASRCRTWSTLAICG